MIHEIKKRLDTWADFMNPASDINFLYVITLDDDPVRPLPYPEDIDKRIDWAVRMYELQTERANWLDDATIPAAMPYTGTEIIAQAFGSPVHYPVDNMPFALPAIRDASGLRALKKPDVMGSNLGELFEIARRIRNRTDGDAIVQLPDIQSPLDIAALIWEKADFLMALIEEPEAVLDLIAMVEEFLAEFLDAWFHEFGTEYIAHFPSFPMRGGFTFSEDEAGEFSPGMFEKFSLPSINRLSRRYGGCAMHCCAFARHQWDGFRRIEGLRLVNITQPGAVIEESARFFGREVCHYPLYSLDLEVQPRPIPNWVKSFDPAAHLVLQANARNAEEARMFADRLREYR